jgi:D-glycero-alpha-D-manno-heptose-7-phosphate kinase
MIVTKTPLRLSWYGGGSDLASFYSKSPGLVVSTAIDRTIQIAVNLCETDHCRVVYSELEVVKHADELKHNRVRSALARFGITSNIEICSFSDVSTKGTGLGSSSTFTVGLVNALAQSVDIKLSVRQIAELACQIEIDDCKEPIGKQDQYAAAVGGMNAFRFNSNGDVDIEPLEVANLHKLNDNFLMYSTGITRKTSDILSKQSRSMHSEKSFDTMKTMVDMAEQSIVYLQKGQIDDFGALLHESWLLKRSLVDNISNYDIDIMYEHARQNGALGGKILGAGGGGYMLLYVTDKTKIKVMEAMKHYKRFDFRLPYYGTQGYHI